MKRYMKASSQLPEGFDPKSIQDADGNILADDMDMCADLIQSVAYQLKRAGIDAQNKSLYDMVFTSLEHAFSIACGWGADYDPSYISKYE